MDIWGYIGGNASSTEPLDVGVNETHHVTYLALGTMKLLMRARENRGYWLV